MERVKHVCSLDLSRQLKKIGIEQESMWFWVRCWRSNKYVYELLGKDVDDCVNEHISAFTVAELGEKLPSFLPSPGGTGDHLLLTSIKNKNKWSIQYFGYPAIIDETEANARAKTLLWINENFPQPGRMAT